MTYSLNEMTSDNVASPMIKLRTYQQEMFERSVEGNTVVVMETGSGKTAVAIYRIMHALETMDDGKLVWFLTGSVALCHQQYEVIRREIPGVKTKVITGHDGPEFWGSIKTWKEVLDGVIVMCSTIDVLYHALAHGYVTIARLGLLIFDEAHHVTKNHSSNMIMREFYMKRRNEREGYPLPAVLGLSASPAENGKEKKLRELEINLAAVCRTPRKHRLELQRHVHRPSLTKLVYQEAKEPVLDRFFASSINQESSSLPTKSESAIRKVKQKLEHVVAELGWWAGWTFIKELVSQLEEKLRRRPSSYRTRSKLDHEELLKHLRPVVQGLAQIHAHTITNDRTQFHISLKALYLIKELISLAEREGADLRAIVFVRQRVVAALLDKILSNHQDLNNIRSGAFVGTSGSVGYEKQLWEWIVPREQENVLRDFRSGDRNIVVSTDALDEGIDVPACNTVICFDPPQNLRSFIQKRGRARCEKSVYTVMASASSSAASFKAFEELEAEMLRLIQKEKREADIASQLESREEEVNDGLASEFTEAYLPASLARGHLEHFCDKLPRTPYTELRPLFNCIEDDHGSITANVRLPMSVPSAVRFSSSRQAWETEKAALRDCALQAYKGLYKHGLLTEHLLAVDTTPHFEAEDPERNKNIQYDTQRLNVWGQTPDHNSHEQRTLYRTPIVVRNETTGWIGVKLALWTPRDISHVQAFDMYSAIDEVFIVEFQSSVRISITEDNVRNILSPCTLTMLMTFRSSVLNASELGFAAFITPDLTLEGLRTWPYQYPQPVRALDFLKKDDTNIHGLIVNVAQGNSLHIFNRWCNTVDDAEEPIVGLECSPFPQKRNFLKVKSNLASSTLEDMNASCKDLGTSVLDAQDCIVMSLPMNYSWTMRFMPSIFYHLEMILTAKSLQEDVLPQVRFRSLSELAQSLTCPATGLVDDYERLEFLGDSLLKFHFSQQVFLEFPDWHEDYLTMQRNTVISNACLAEVAVARGIEKYILHDAFVGKRWTVPSVTTTRRQPRSDRLIRVKALADVVEALIGASFLCGGMKNARLCMAALHPKVQQDHALSNGIIHH